LVTSFSSRFGRFPRDALAPAAILLVAVGTGLFTGRDPLLGVALAAGLVFALIVMSDLALGVCLFLLVAFLDVVSRNQDLSLTKAAGAVLAGSWLAMMATRPRTEPGLTTEAPWLAGAVVAFLAWSAMSVFWAESHGAALRSTFRYTLDALLIPIAFWAIRERKQVVWIFAVFVAGSLLSVLWGLVVGKVAGGAAAAQVGRLSGATVEANELATLLVVCILFAGALALVTKRATFARAMTVLAGIAALVALFGTFSRAGLLALGVVILISCFYAGKSRPVFIALVIGTLVVGGVFLHDTSSGTAQRLTSQNTNGRSSIWTVGLRIVGANPIVGVGSGNYTVVEPHYVLVSPGALPATDFVLENPYPAHNIYLEILAEMGVIGLALFMSLIVMSIWAAVKAVRIFTALGDRSMEILGRALVLAMVGILAADFFASDEYSKQLWMLLAMGPVLLAIARRSLAGGAYAQPRQPRRRSLVLSHTGGR
jgi:O-antigen ligase